MADTFWKFSTGFCDTDEVHRLSAALNLSIFAAGALVALLYAWGAEKAADDGSINDYTERAIESACMWDGDRGALIAAFHNAGILSGDLENRSDDNPLVIAAWASVASDLIKKRNDARDRKRKQRDKERDGMQNVMQDVTRDGMCDGTQDVTPPKKAEGRNHNEEAENIFAASAAGDRPDFNTVEVYAANNLAPLSPGNMEDMSAFKAELPEELIRHAVDEACAANKRTWGYVRAILLRYITDDIRTVGEAKQRTQQPKQSTKEIKWG